MESDIIENFISTHKNSNKLIERISIFETVRNFVYQINGVSDHKKLLEVKEGYCASKHRLLKEIYNKLGYQTKLCFAPFSFNMIYLPDDLKNWGYANKKGYHTFLQMFIDGKWIDIDATFNKELKSIYTVNENRDGFSSQKAICDYGKIYIPNSLEEELEIKKLLSDPRKMSEKDNERIKKFNDWVKFTK